MYIKKNGREDMGKKIGVIILLAACVGLGVLLLTGDYFSSDGLRNAEPAHAEVVEIKGVVRKISSLGGRVSTLVPGNALFMNDSVQTGANSAVTILFADESKILVTENSLVSMVRMRQSKKTGDVDTLIKISSGSVESRVTTKKNFGAKYEVRTPSMHMAVRGTVFNVSVDKETGKTSSSVLKGMVVATASGTTIELPAGYGTVAEVGKPPATASLLLDSPIIDDFPQVIKKMPVQFSWKPLPEAVRYRLQIFAGDSGELLMYDRIGPENSVDLTDLPDSRYVMRVSGITEAGIEGRNSDQLFSLAAHPVPPVASWPVNTENSSLEKVKFRWSCAESANSYIVQVSDQEDFSHIVSEVANLPGKMKGISIKLAPGHYFWRVASTSVKEGQGPFSDHYAFSVVEPAK
jgi:hypothetical protein